MRALGYSSKQIDKTEDPFAEDEPESWLDGFMKKFSNLTKGGRQ